jgi:hypothetical protein
LHGGIIFRPLDFHLQQRQGQRLALGIAAHRPARPACQDVIKDEIECQQIGRFEADNTRRVQRAKVVAHALGRQELAEPGVARFGVGDDRDVGMVPFVAAPAVGDVGQEHLEPHHGNELPWLAA